MRFSDQEVDVVMQQLSAKLTSQRLMLAVAESCTGGALGAVMTEVPGASRWFKGGVIAYANDVKQHALGIEHDLLDGHGAVSAEVARAMAVGVLRTTGSDVGVSLTGVAGPDGGTKEKPVGMVWCGVARRGGASAVRLFNLQGDRAAIRYQAVKAALQLLSQFLDGDKIL